MSDYGWPEGITETKKEVYAAIIWTAYLHGPFENDSGKATKLIYDLVAKSGYPMAPAYFNKHLNDIDGSTRRMKARIGRDMSAKRTYKIWYLGDADDLPPWPWEGEPEFRAEDAPDTEEDHEGEEEVPEPAAAVLEPTDEAATPKTDEVDLAAGEIEEDQGLPTVLVETVREPSTALEPHPSFDHQPDEAEMLAYAISALQEVQGRLLSGSAFQFEKYLTGRVDLVDTLTNENAQLRHQLVEARQEIAELKQTLTRVTAPRRARA